MTGSDGQVPAALHALLRGVGTVWHPREDGHRRLVTGDRPDRRSWSENGAVHRRGADAAPGVQDLVGHALGRRLLVEVFSNLVHVTDDLWEVFSQPRISLATSYYSDQPEQHAAITGRASYARTKTNIAEALRRGIPLRAGVIDLGNGQRAGQAQNELAALGVPLIGYDRLCQVGRGVRDQQVSSEQLCGHCGDGVTAISPVGVVWPCVFSRWLPIGNVLEAKLAEILASPEADRVRRQCGLWLIQQIQAVWPEPMDSQVQERLSV
jgi:Iron-sulfur cluster-binding domain